MTECCSCLTAHSPSMYDYKYAHMVGTIVSGTQLKFVNAAGVESDAGEILAQGPQCAMGYLNNPLADNESFDEEGRIHTGDGGKIDGNGVVTITGRLKDIITVIGTAVVPAELEEVLLRREKILDAAVIEIPDFCSGELPKAYVVLNHGINPSEPL
jgi:4-coumarate--CoA ligase